MPIKQIVYPMFWAPDEVAGTTEDRAKQGIENPGVLTFLPDEAAGLAEHIVGEPARAEDEPIRPRHSFESQS